MGPARRSDGDIGREASAVPLGARAAAAAAARDGKSAPPAALGCGLMDLDCGLDTTDAPADLEDGPIPIITAGARAPAPS